MNYFRVLIITASAIVLTGCAASYRPVSPKNISYSTGAESDGLMMLYRYDVMRSAGNKRYARRAAAKGIRILAVEISNQSDRPINLRQDISIYAGDHEVVLLEPEFVRKQIKQIAPLYLLWSLLWVVVTKCDQDDCTVLPLPVGAVIGVTNTRIASRSNKALLHDLNLFNLLDKTIQPGETVHGLIAIAAESEEPLEIVIK